MNNLNEFINKYKLSGFTRMDFQFWNYKGNQYIDVAPIDGINVVADKATFDKCHSWRVFFHDVNPEKHAEELYKKCFADDDWNTLNDDIRDQYIDMTKQILRKQIIEKEKKEKKEKKENDENYKIIF